MCGFGKLQISYRMSIKPQSRNNFKENGRSYNKNAIKRAPNQKSWYICKSKERALEN